MDIIEFAQKELNALLNNCDKKGKQIQQLANKNILELLKLFDSQNHTGFSANYVLSTFNRLSQFKPLSPLTGEDDEWKQIDVDGMKYQNKRCPSVFRDKDGNCYNIEGRIFSDDGGNTWYTSKDSKVKINFPYEVPKYPEQIIVKDDKREQLLLAIKTLFIAIINQRDEKNITIEPKDITEQTRLSTMLINQVELQKLQEYIAITYKITQDYDINYNQTVGELIDILYKYRG